MKHWVTQYLHIVETMPERVIRPDDRRGTEDIGQVFIDLFERNIPIQLAHVSYGGELGSHHRVVNEIGLEQIEEGLLVYGNFTNVMNANVLKDRDLGQFGQLDAYFKKGRKKLPFQKINRLQSFFIFDKHAEIAIHNPEKKRFTIRKRGSPSALCLVINDEVFVATPQDAKRVTAAIEKYMGWVTPKRRR